MRIEQYDEDGKFAAAGLLADWLADNDDDPDLCADLRALQSGQTLIEGGGGAPVVMLIALADGWEARPCPECDGDGCKPCGYAGIVGVVVTAAEAKLPPHISGVTTAVCHYCGVVYPPSLVVHDDCRGAFETIASKGG